MSQKLSCTTRRKRLKRAVFCASLFSRIGIGCKFILEEGGRITPRAVFLSSC